MLGGFGDSASIFEAAFVNRNRPCKNQALGFWKAQEVHEVLSSSTQELSQPACLTTESKTSFPASTA